jgi:hypothetical protein
MIKQLFDQSDWLATLVAAIAYWVIGAVWYGILGKRWMTAANLTKDRIDASSKIVYLYTFILELVIVMAMSAMGANAMTTGDAIQFGLIIGLIFSAFTTWVHYMYTLQSKDLYWIDAGYTTIASIVAAVILSMM